MFSKYNITGDQIPHFIAHCSHECGCGALGIEKYGGSDQATYFSDRDIRRENFDAVDLTATDHINSQKLFKTIFHTALLGGVFSGLSCENSITPLTRTTINLPNFAHY